MKRSHEALGKDVVVMVVGKQTPQMMETAPDHGGDISAARTSTAVAMAVASAELEPVLVSIDPLIAELAAANQESLQQLAAEKIGSWVTLTFDIKQSTAVVSPTCPPPANWKDTCPKEVLFLLQNQYRQESLTIPDEASSLVYPMIFQKQSRSGAQITYTFEEGSGGPRVLKLAGDQHVVAKLMQQIDVVYSTVVKKRETMKLDDEDFVFVSEMKQNELKHVAKSLEISFDRANHTISVHGPLKAVDEFKQQLAEIKKHCRITFQSSPSVLQYLSSPAGNQVLMRLIKNTPSPMVPHFCDLLVGSQRSKSVVLIGHHKDADSIAACSSNLLLLFAEKQSTLPKYFTPSVLDSVEFKQLQERLESEHSCAISIQKKGNLIVAGVKEGIDPATKSVLAYITNALSSTESVKIKGGVWRLITDQMPMTWNRMVSSLQKRGVIVSETTFSNQTFFVIKISGFQEELQVAREEVQRVCQSVVVGSVQLSRPGAAKFFQEESQGKMMIDSIQHKFKVCIEIEQMGEQSAAAVMDTSLVSKSYSKVCLAHTNEMKQVTVFVGDITEFPCDVIVNAANVDLVLGGGVAGAILSKGGQAIQDDCTRFVRKNGRLDDGDAVLLHEVGNLSCKAMVHAVGPRWEGGGERKKALLVKACRESLKAASKYRSVSLPAISSGIFGFPVAIAAECLVQGVVEFSQDHAFSELKEINFVIQDANKDIFISTVKQHLQIVHAQGSRPEQHTPAIPLFDRKRQRRSSSSTSGTSPIILLKGSILNVKV